MCGGWIIRFKSGRFKSGMRLGGSPSGTQRPTGVTCIDSGIQGDWDGTKALYRHNEVDCIIL